MEQRKSIAELIWDAIMSGVKFSNRDEDIADFKKSVEEDEWVRITEYNASELLTDGLINDYLVYIKKNALFSNEGCDSCACFTGDIRPCNHMSNLLACYPADEITSENSSCALGDKVTPIERYACSANFNCKDCHFNKNTFDWYDYYD